MNPIATTWGILTAELPDELVIFDSMRQRYHRLNATCAWIWRNSDGSRTVEELARGIARKFALDNGPEVVRVALAQLEDAGLVKCTTSYDTAANDTNATSPERSTRRAALQRLFEAGMAAALVPMVTSVAVARGTGSSSSGGTGHVSGFSSNSSSGGPSYGGNNWNGGSWTGKFPSWGGGWN